MKTRSLVVLMILVAVMAIGFHAGALINQRASTAALQSAQPLSGYCFTESVTGGMVTAKIDAEGCFSALGGSYWCDGIGYARCVFPENRIDRSTSSTNSQHPTPVPSPSEPTGGNVAPPTVESPEVERPGGYLNDPFGVWSEPGYCLANGSKQFDLFEYTEAIDCIEKVTDGEACDYENNCFTDERALVNYLKTFSQ